MSQAARQRRRDSGSAVADPAIYLWQRWVILLMYLAVTAPATACSLLFTEPPPKHPALGEEIPCSSNYLWPGLDTAFAGFQLYRTGFAISHTDADYGPNPRIDRPTDIVLGSVLLILAASSAGIGFSRVSECREAQGIFSRTGTTPSMTTGPETEPSMAPPTSKGFPAATRPASNAPAKLPEVKHPAPNAIVQPPSPPVRQQGDDEDPNPYGRRPRSNNTGD